MPHGRKLAVIGLGYVGLPVAVAFGRGGTPVIGFDTDTARIAELKAGRDRTREVEPGDIAHPHLHFTSDPAELAGADFFIVTVPTPIDQARRPDLTALLRASKTVGSALKKGDIVVYESTVYPGATEEDCVPILEQASGLSAGRDFTVGYSPERINPGDKAHRFEAIKKVVAGQDARTLDIVAAVYGSVVTAGLHKAPSIKVAEAAKVIENAQRDLNIAFMNELSAIFHALDIDTQDVLSAAATKWNFLNFTRPGRRALHRGRSLLSHLSRAKGRLPSRRDPCGSAHQRFDRGARSTRMPAPAVENRHAEAAGDGAGANVQGEYRRCAQFAGLRYHS